MREELGDVLMQVVFHAQMEREQGNFDFDDVCDEVCRKLIIRHPHVLHVPTFLTQLLHNTQLFPAELLIYVNFLRNQYFKDLQDVLSNYIELRMLM